MRKVLIGIGIVLLVALVAVVAIPLLVPVERYRGLIESQAEKMTGREVSIGGPIALSLFPRLALEVEDVRIANPPGAPTPEMARLERLELGVALWPLLEQRIEVEKLVLVEPQIDLIVDARGTPNWQFAEQAEEPETPAPEQGRALAVEIADVAIEDGRLSYADLRTEIRYEVEQVDLSAEFPGLDAPASAEGELVYRGEAIAFSLAADRPRALLEGGETPMRVEIAADPVALSFAGAAAGGEAPRAVGELSLDIASVAEAMRWLAAVPAEEPLPVEAVALATRIEATAERAALNGLQLEMDDLEVTGELQLALAGGRSGERSRERPRLSGELATGVIDLDAYLPTSEPGQESGGDEAARPPAGWSAEPIDFSALGLVDADLKIAMAGIARGDIVLGPAVLTLALDAGRLAAALSEARLAEGVVGGEVRVDASAAPPSFAADLSVADVQAEPLLAVLAGFDRLAGMANGELTLSARGASPQAIVSSLDGRGSFVFLNGAIHGINIPAVVRELKTAFLDPSARGPQETDFAELSASFVLREGIAHTEDLTLVAPLLRLSGRGDVILPEREVALVLEPRIVGSLEGQGAARDAAPAAEEGIGVPILVTGSFDRLRFTPYLRGIAEDALRDPGAIGAQIETLKETVTGDRAEETLEGLLRGIGGGLREVPESRTEEAAPPPPAEGPAEGGETEPQTIDRLRQIFGR